MCPYIIIYSVYLLIDVFGESEYCLTHSEKKQQLKPQMIGILRDTRLIIWRFPTIGVLPNHFFGGNVPRCSLINHPASGVAPFMEAPILLH